MSRDDAYGRESEPPAPGSHRPVRSKIASPGTKCTGYVVGPNGDVVTLADLPSPRTTRWVIRRKAEVVLAVHGGLLSLDDACRRYRLTTEEFRAWQSAIERHGLLGLRSTHLQDYRQGGKS
jgi:hypothetical protein